MTEYEKPKPGLSRWLSAFKNSYKGIKYGLKNEAAIREELIFIALSVIVAPIISQSALHAVALIISVLFLLVVEVLNSAIEATVDRISTQLHPLSGAAKDLGSLAVLIAIIINLLFWGTSIWLHLTQ